MITTADQRVPVIAVVEDYPALRDNLAQALRANGFDVLACASAEDFYRQAAKRAVDIVLIDLGLPGESGLSAIGHLRGNAALGIVVITGRSAPADRIAAYTAGADYYLLKPVDLGELLAILTALWRRMQVEPRDRAQPAAAAWRLDRLQHCLQSPSGQAVPLSPGEVLLLACLAEVPGSAVSKADLCTRLFARHSNPDPHRIDVLVSRLRRKCRNHAVPLRSLFGRGLAFIDTIETADGSPLLPSSRRSENSPRLEN